MATLSEARQNIATAMSTVGTFNVTARPPRYPKAGDGWVVITSIEPSTFTLCAATFTVVVLLSSDLELAEDLYETHGVEFINAATTLLVADVSLEAISLAVGTASAEFHALTLTLTTEVN